MQISTDESYNEESFGTMRSLEIAFIEQDISWLVERNFVKDIDISWHVGTGFLVWYKIKGVISAGQTWQNARPIDSNSSTFGNGSLWNCLNCNQCFMQMILATSPEDVCLQISSTETIREAVAKGSNWKIISIETSGPYYTGPQANQDIECNPVDWKEVPECIEFYIHSNVLIRTKMGVYVSSVFNIVGSGCASTCDCESSFGLITAHATVYGGGSGLVGYAVFSTEEPFLASLYISNGGTGYTNDQSLSFLISEERIIFSDVPGTTNLVPSADGSAHSLGGSRSPCVAFSTLEYTISGVIVASGGIVSSINLEFEESLSLYEREKTFQFVSSGYSCHHPDRSHQDDNISSRLILNETATEFEVSDGVYKYNTGHFPIIAGTIVGTIFIRSQEYGDTPFQTFVVSNSGVFSFTDIVEFPITLAISSGSTVDNSTGYIEIAWSNGSYNEEFGEVITILNYEQSVRKDTLDPSIAPMGFWYHNFYEPAFQQWENGVYWPFPSKAQADSYFGVYHTQIDEISPRCQRLCYHEPALVASGASDYALCAGCIPKDPYIVKMKARAWISYANISRLNDYDRNAGQTDPPPTVVILSGNTTKGSKIATISSTLNLKVGMRITTSSMGPFGSIIQESVLPTETYIDRIDSLTSFVMTKEALLTATVVFTFTSVVTVLQPASRSITACGICTAIPAVLYVSHNLNVGAFYNFSLNNKIILPNYFAMHYSKVTECWTSNYSVVGSGSASEERWSFTFKWACTSSGNSSDNFLWKFSILMNRYFLDTGKDEDSIVHAFFPAENLCKKISNFYKEFSFALNTKTKNVINDMVEVNEEVVLSDNIGMFTLSDWKKNPLIRIRISKDSSSFSNTKQDLRSLKS